MLAYRLASRQYPPDNSEGARLSGGRWNLKGTPVIYASTSKALAAFEVFANRGGLSQNYMVVEIDIPDDLKRSTVSPAVFWGSDSKARRDATATWGTASVQL